MGLGGLVLGSLIVYLKGMRILMFQLSGIYHKASQRLHWEYTLNYSGIPNMV